MELVILHILCLISIHALREEGDPLGCIGSLSQWNISIHALREEGDQGPGHRDRR